MADYCWLSIDYINLVLKKLEGGDGTRLQLNVLQCLYLAQKLVETRTFLLDNIGKLKGATDIRQTALLHLLSVIKRAQSLVENCSGDDATLLDAALTLGEIKEDVVAIVLSLCWWKSSLDIAIASVTGVSNADELELLSSAEEEYGRLSKKSRSALDDAAIQDKNKLQLKVAGLRQQHTDHLQRECILAVHLDSRLNPTEEEIPKAISKKLREYTNPEMLGNGAFGVVLGVTWLEHLCALKVINASDEKEATVLKGLQHPNIVRCFHYWKAPRSHIMMERMPTDLNEYIEAQLNCDVECASSSHIAERSSKLKEQKMPFILPVAIDIMLQVAQAMSYLHSQNLTHRDLKPKNILVRRVSPSLHWLHSQGFVEVKLADFGVAQTYDYSSITKRLTPNIGTPAYRAPEIYGQDWAMERNYPQKADIWSFGIVFSELMTGKKPFADEKGGMALLHKRITQQNKRPSLPPDCPGGLRFCIESCWNLNPARRPSFPDISRILRHALWSSLGLASHDSFAAYVLRYGGVRRSMSETEMYPWRWRGILKGILGKLRLGGASYKYSSPKEQSYLGESELLGTDLNKADKITHLAEFRMDPRELEQSKMVFFKHGENFGLEDLFRASVDIMGDNVSNKAYKAVLGDSSIVFVKRLDNVKTARKEFQTRIETVGRLQHRNLVPLRAYYFSTKEKLLVYEYKPMGSLSALLHGANRRPLHWISRVDIALGSARGLAYLHKEGGPNYAHGNIKSTNILFDKNHDPCISDYCLALLISPAWLHINGYRAPEVSCKFTSESDVYSFGVLLLELLTGKDPGPTAEGNRRFDLPKLASTFQALDMLFDQDLFKNLKKYQRAMGQMMQLAMCCVDVEPDKRPKMCGVVHMLEAIQSHSVADGEASSQQNPKSSNSQDLGPQVSVVTDCEISSQPDPNSTTSQDPDSQVGFVYKYGVFPERPDLAKRKEIFWELLAKPAKLGQ